MNTNEMNRYPDKDLEKFRVLIEEKINKAQHDLELIRSAYMNDGNSYNNTKQTDKVRNARYDTGDVITMELNGKNKTVSFYKNDESVYKMKDVKPLRYRLAIELTSHGSYGKACMTLAKFEFDVA